MVHERELDVAKPEREVCRTMESTVLDATSTFGWKITCCAGFFITDILTMRGTIPETFKTEVRFQITTAVSNFKLVLKCKSEHLIYEGRKQNNEPPEHYGQEGKI